eukprot:2535396-Prymnesium_polylepis.1
MSSSADAAGHAGGAPAGRSAPPTPTSTDAEDPPAMRSWRRGSRGVPPGRGSRDGLRQSRLFALTADDEGALAAAGSAQSKLDL